MRDRNPVWDVYNDYRTARLNVKYLSIIIGTYENYDFYMALAIAIFAPSSAIAGLGFWNTVIGSYLWKIFIVISSVIALVKPMLKLPEKVKKLQDQLRGYRILENDLKIITIGINQEKQFSQDLRKKFQESLDRLRDLSQKDEVKEDRKLIRKCFEEVKKELPSSSFYIPK
jgi:hypothetical protein